MGLIRLLALCLLPGAALASAQVTSPPYRTLRHDEDYAYLSDPSRRSDWADPVKYIALSGTRADWYLSLSGELRERVEVFKNASWQPAPADAFVLQRYMVSADLHLGTGVRIWAGIKSGLEDGRIAGPRAADEDKLDLHEAFLDVNLGEHLTIRAGRRELAFGSQRLVSIRQLNVRQSFDGVSVLAAPGAWRLEAFVTKPVRTDPGVFDDDTDHTRTFWGIYATGSLRLFRDAGIDVYYMGLDRKLARYDQGTAPELRESVGTRVWRRTAPWDYNFEAVYQWGRFGLAPISAWTFASDSGLTLRTAPWRPRFGLKADITSGDTDPRESALQSFNPLFPRGAYFSESGLIGPVNHIDLHPSIDFHPFAKITVSPGWDFFWRTSTKDGVYGVPGNLVRPANGATARHVRSQPAVMLTVGLGRHASLVAEGEYFIAGPFLRESGSARNVSFFAGWFSYVF